jgi:hypothetical protein
VIAAGKTCAARHANGYGFVKVSFADPLKLEVYDAVWDNDPALKEFPGGSPVVVDPHILGAPDIAKAMPAFQKTQWVDDNKAWLRDLLRWWGTEYRRAQNPYYWLDRFEVSVSRHLGQGHHVVVDDCRFDNEINLITDLGGYHAYIHTPDAKAFELERDGKVTETSHSSEGTNDPLDPRWDFMVLNNRDFPRFHFQLDALIEALLEGDVGG